MKTIKFEKTFTGEYLPGNLGYLIDNNKKIMTGIFFTEKGIVLSNTKSIRCKSPTYIFKNEYEAVGRLKLADGNIARLVFCKDGLKICVGLKSKTSGSIMWGKPIDDKFLGIGSLS